MLGQSYVPYASAILAIQEVAGSDHPGRVMALSEGKLSSLSPKPLDQVLCYCRRRGIASEQTLSSFGPALIGHCAQGFARVDCDDNLDDLDDDGQLGVVGVPVVGPV